MSEYIEGEKEFLQALLGAVGSSWSDDDLQIDGGGPVEGLTVAFEGTFQGRYFEAVVSLTDFRVDDADDWDDYALDEEDEDA